MVSRSVHGRSGVPGKYPQSSVATAKVTPGITGTVVVDSLASIMPLDDAIVATTRQTRIQNFFDSPGSVFMAGTSSSASLNPPL